MLNLTTVAQILWTSLATSSYYVMFAVAFSLVLKVNGVFNFAQAGLMTIAFYTAHWFVAGLGAGGAVAFAAALGATLGGAWLLETFGFAMLRRNNASQMFVFIFTIVASEFIAYLAMLLFGTWPKTIFPQLFWPVTLVGDVAVSAWDLPAIAARFGLLTVLIAAVFITVGMFLYGTRAQVQPLTSLELMLFAALATILGGIGRIGGAAVAAVLLAVVQNSSILVIPSEWQGFLLYVFLFVTIIFFPRGIRLPQRMAKLAR
jgi:branched-subunit amino acid ABC-type transport system permease component